MIHAACNVMLFNSVIKKLNEKYGVGIKSVKLWISVVSICCE